MILVVNAHPVNGGEAAVRIGQIIRVCRACGFGSRVPVQQRVRWYNSGTAEVQQRYANCESSGTAAIQLLHQQPNSSTAAVH